MTVKARNLGEPPPREPYSLIARIIALGVIALLLILGLRALPSAFAPAQSAERPTPAGEVPAPLRLAVTPVIEPTVEPTTGPLAQLAARLDPTAPPLPAGCPPAEVLPEGTRAGWVARAAGCPDVLYASVGGVRRWVRRPINFPDALYEQLPELPAR